MLGNLFKGKETKALRRALELTAQKALIDEELKDLRAQLGKALEEAPNKCFTLDGEGMAILQVTERPVLNTDLLLKMLVADKNLLAKFTKEMCIVKQTNLEKYLGTPVFNTLINGKTTNKTVRFLTK